ncbi:MAG: hypothetical protein RL708_311, partial [Bacteroidota bacterium]
MARCPDGTGNFVAGWPTFNRLNCGNGVGEVVERNGLIVYPNPASQSLVISYQSPESNREVNTIDVKDILGRTCISILNHKSEIINIEFLPSGIYFIKATDEKGNQLNAKFIKQ